MKHQTPQEQGSTQRWIFFLLIAGLVAITFLYLISRIFEYSGPSLLHNPYSAENTPKHILIGDMDFMVPPNTIRRHEQRVASSVNQLDLVFLWPSMAGYSRDKQVAFSDATKKSNLIFVSISRPDTILLSSERLYSVYSQFFSGDPVRGPATLIGFAMDDSSGFGGETVYFKPESTEPFVARCIKPDNKEPPFCMREIGLGATIQITYRFRPHLLSQWKTLDDHILDRLGGFLVP